MFAATLPIAATLNGTGWMIVSAGLASGFVCLCLGQVILRRRSAPVASVLSYSSSSILIGAPLSNWDLRTQPDPFECGSPDERRSSVRRMGKLRKVLITSPEWTGGQREGWIVDRSVGGLGITMNQAVKPFTMLTLRTVDASDRSAWTQVEVRNVTRKNKNWHVGVRFVKTPPYDVMLQFG